MPDTTTIDKFLGLNMNETGETNLELGESPNMINFKITKDFKLQKMYGYTKICTVGTGTIRALQKMKINSIEYFILVTSGKVYTINSSNVATEIGTVTDGITNVFAFNNKIYIITGNEYKSYDGTTLEDVAGYIPLIKISTTPQGIGTDYEGINLLTNKKRQTFSPDGTSTVFHIVETNVTSIDKVKVNGIEVTTGFTVNTTNGTVTFSTAPATGVDNIEIYWTGTENNRDKIYKNKYYKLYGLADDTRVFLYGNPYSKNRIYFSDLGDGVPNVEYFPATNFIDIGSSNTAVTDINRQYDRLIISKENETYYATYSPITDTTNATIITFSAYPLNDAHGMVAYGQGQVLNNYVATIDSSIVIWTNTETKDERNAQIISTKVQEWLKDKDLSKAVTMDYQIDKEYWMAVDDEVLIYNYENACFSLLKLPIEVKIIYYDGMNIYAGDNEGNIYKFNEEETTYGGETINARWESGFMDFGAEYVRKTMRKVWIALKPFSKSSLKIGYITDRETSYEDLEIYSNSIDYNYIDYADWSYNTNRNIKPYRIKIKAKKFAYEKIIIKNEKNLDKLIVNSITIKKTFGSETK